MPEHPHRTQPSQPSQQLGFDFVEPSLEPQGAAAPVPAASGPVRLFAPEAAPESVLDKVQRARAAARKAQGLGQQAPRKARVAAPKAGRINAVSLEAAQPEGVAPPLRSAPSPRLLWDAELLEQLVSRTMPFGKHEGTLLVDLPGHYLHWFARSGFPKGEIGRLLALLQELDHNGLRPMLDPLRRSPRQRPHLKPNRA